MSELRTLIAYCHTKSPDKVCHIEMQDIAKAVCGCNEGIAYYHSHTSSRKGGYFSPHLHIIIAIDFENVDSWMNTVRDEFNRVKGPLWTLTNQLDNRTYINDLGKTLAYCYGGKRFYIPEYIFSSPRWFQVEQKITGKNHLQSSKRYAIF